MTISTLGVCIALAAANTAPPARGPVADLARGFQALRAGDFHESARALDGLAQKLPRNRDYALYLLGESLFYDGSYARARAAFSELAKLRPSRFAGVAAWRAADCQWIQGQRSEAATVYRRGLKRTVGSWPERRRARMRRWRAFVWRSSLPSE